MPPVRSVAAFIRYWLDAVDAHSLHSPFLYDFYTKVLRGPEEPGTFADIELLRQKLLKDDRSIELDTPGGSSQVLVTAHPCIRDVARTSLTPPRFASLYYRIARFFEAKIIVELGTSLGINTLYFAKNENAMVHTFEGAPALIDIAELTFEFAGARNVNLHRGNIDQMLPGFIQGLRHIDLVLMDANHRYEPTVRYFNLLLPRLDERSVLIIDDIHRSPGMEQAWREIRMHELVYMTVDLFRCGIAWFDPSLSKQNVVLEF